MSLSIVIDECYLVSKEEAKKVNAGKAGKDEFWVRNFKVKVLDGPNGEYEHIFPVQVTKDRCDAMDMYEEGDCLKLSINISGRAWKDTAFISFTAWKVEGVQQYGEQGHDGDPEDKEDLPF